MNTIILIEVQISSMIILRQLERNVWNEKNYIFVVISKIVVGKISIIKLLSNYSVSGLKNSAESFVTQVSNHR